MIKNSAKAKEKTHWELDNPYLDDLTQLPDQVPDQVTSYIVRHHFHARLNCASEGGCGNLISIFLTPQHKPTVRQTAQLVYDVSATTGRN